MRMLAERNGMFGPIRILERRCDGARLYCIKASVQTMVSPEGVSLFGYVHAAKLLLKPARRVLIIGGGGGSLATMLARKGHRVTVVDIDPAAEELARLYFALDARVRWLTADPMRFLEGDREPLDAIMIDACDASGLVAPFNDADTLHRILTRACVNGSIVLNLVHEDDAPPPGAMLSRRLVALGLNATLYRAEDGWEGNEILHARASGPTHVLSRDDIMHRPPQTRTYLMSLRPWTPAGETLRA